jgi:hypothetical protein
MKQHEFEEPAKAALADNNVAAHGKWLEDLATPQKVNFDQSKAGDAGAIKMAQAGNVPDEPEEETEAHEAGAQKSIAEQLLAEDPKKSWTRSEDNARLDRAVCLKPGQSQSLDPAERWL